MLANDIPFANSKGRATGLWTINGKIVFAPDDWLDHMPKVFLDGELFTTRNDRQRCRSIVSQHEPDDRWSDVRLVAFGSPPLRTVFKDGKIDSAFFKKTFKGVVEWAEPLLKGIKTFDPTTQFHEVYGWLKNNTTQNANYELLQQVEVKTIAEVNAWLQHFDEIGGEGVVLKYKYGYWIPERDWNCLKYKKLKDAEAEVLGYIWGDKGVEDKLVGLMGSLTVKWHGNVFQLSGFNESERIMRHADGSNACAVGFQHPGETVEQGIENPLFPIGSIVTFQYRGLTTDGLPIEARYWRNYEVE